MKKQSVFSTMMALAVILCAADSSFAEYYHVEIAGLDPGQPISPAAVVIHGQNYKLFEVGMPATMGLEGLAEDGMAHGLADEAQGMPDVFASLVGGSAPTFTAHKFIIEGHPGQLFSFACMLAKTNDIFVGAAGVELPADGNPVTVETMAYDAGTEENTGMAAHIPAFGNVGVGPTENGTVQVINSYAVQDDPGASGPVSYTWPPAARLTITPMPEAVHYHAKFVSITEGQPLSPPVVAVHDADASAFMLGQPASTGIERMAEQGMADPLIAELTPMMGVWTAFAGGTGGAIEHEFSFIAQPGQLVTILSMIGRTNDAFTGIDSAPLPMAGGSIDLETIAWDAGTEVNTGLMADLPAYGGEGSPEEGGAVTELNSYSIIDDPNGREDFTWPPVARITINTETSSVSGWSLYE